VRRERRSLRAVSNKGKKEGGSEMGEKGWREKSERRGKRKVRGSRGGSCEERRQCGG